MEVSEAGAPAIMTLIELAEYMRVHPSTITRLMRTRGLPGFRIARNWRFRKLRIDQWIGEQEQ